MFDIGFSELLVIGIVALVVIGPEKLPRVARTLGHLFGKLQRYVSQVKSDINREMDMADLKNVKAEFEGAARGFQSDLKEQAAQTEREFRDVQTQIDRDLAMEPGLISEPPAETAPAEPSPQMELGIEPAAPKSGGPAAP